MSSIRDLLKRGREASTALPLDLCGTLGDGEAWSPPNLPDVSSTLRPGLQRLGIQVTLS